MLPTPATKHNKEEIGADTLRHPALERMNVRCPHRSGCTFSKMALKWTDT